jgi:hypothetical protein
MRLRWAGFNNDVVGGVLLMPAYLTEDKTDIKLGEAY